MYLSTQDRESLIKVKLLGNLKTGDKISTYRVEIMPDCVTTKWNRWMYGETRSQTVTFCRNSIQSVLVLLEKNKTNLIMKKIMDADLAAARKGLISLQETYSTDIRVVSELEAVIQSIT